MILRKRTIGPAPSTLAESSTSDETDVMPDSRITAANGKPRQTLTEMIDMIARVGSPSQFGLMPGFRRPAACPSQLTMLYWVSSIHFQAIELRTIGTVHGKRM